MIYAKMATGISLTPTPMAAKNVPATLSVLSITKVATSTLESVTANVTLLEEIVINVCCNTGA